MTLAEKVRRLRERRGWNMSDLSRATDIPQPTIWRIERGMIVQPKAGILQRLAQALEVSADYLLAEGEREVSFDEMLRRDPMGQAVFRGYEGLTPRGREQVRSFVDWLVEQEKKRREKP